jgi:hypothetical protein
MKDKRTTHLAGMGAARDATTKTRTATREVVRMVMCCVDSTLSSAMVAVYIRRWALTRTMGKSRNVPRKRVGGEGQNGKAQDVHPLLISMILFLQMYRTLSCMSS